MTAVINQQYIDPPTATVFRPLLRQVAPPPEQEQSEEQQSDSPPETVEQQQPVPETETSPWLPPPKQPEPEGEEY
jgi:hypothetical protein